jgi:hypothetical protein
VRISAQKKYRLASPASEDLRYRSGVNGLAGVLHLLLGGLLPNDSRFRQKVAQKNRPSPSKHLMKGRVARDFSLAPFLLLAAQS